MTRTLNIFVLGMVLGVCTAPANAQDVFQVTAARANVRQQPTTASAVVAHVDRDTVLTVDANLGSWLRVELPDAGHHVGFIHRSLGTVRHTELEKTMTVAPAPEVTATSPAAESAAPQTTDGSLEVHNGARPQTVAEPLRTLPRTHDEMPTRLGLGGRAGGFTFGIGASVRSWQKGPLGFELQLSHYGVGYQDSGSAIQAKASISVTQIAPVVLYRFSQSDEDDVVVTPYVGGGMNFYRSTTSATATGYGFTEKQSTSELSKGIVAMGGAEVRFKSAPRFTVSGDLGYYTTAIPFGMQIGGIAWSVSGHWYVH